MITHDSLQLKRENDINNILRSKGFPTMQFQKIEFFGQSTAIAISEKLFPVDITLDSNHISSIEFKVKRFLFRMMEQNIFCSDLQFMLDQDGNPIFMDPMSISFNANFDIIDASYRAEDLSKNFIVVAEKKYGEKYVW